MNIETNLQKLQDTDFSRLLRRLSVTEIDGKIVSYLTVMVDQDTGEILEIDEGVRVFDNMVTSPIAVTRENLKEDVIQLALADDGSDGLPEKVRGVIEASFKAFNQAQET